VGYTYIQLGEDEYDRRWWFFDPTNGQLPIEDLPGQYVTFKGLTDNGWAYGGYGNVRDVNWNVVDQRAFVWHADVGFIDLMNAGRMTSADRWRLYDVVSGDGQRFVGYAVDSDWNSSVFLATRVPEAESRFFAFAMFAMVAIVSRRPAPLLVKASSHRIAARSCSTNASIGRA
jgi:hypothetical protein